MAPPLTKARAARMTQDISRPTAQWAHSAGAVTAFLTYFWLESFDSPASGAGAGASVKPMPAVSSGKTGCGGKSVPAEV